MANGSARVAAADFVALTYISLVFVGGTWMLLTLAPNFDNAWLQEAARRIFVQGGSFQRDALEVNPPLAIAIFAPSAWIEHWLGLNADRVYQIGFLAFGAWSAFFIRPILAWALGGELKGALAAGSSFAITVFGSTTLFGERDLMALLLSLPFIIWWCGKLAGKEDNPPLSTTLAFAAFAAIGFLLKPTTALVPASLLLAWVWQQRKLWALYQPHFMLMLAVAALYGISILTVFSDWIPVGQLGLRVYWAYTVPWSVVWQASTLEWLQLGALGLLILMLPADSRIRKFVVPLAICALMFQISMLLQKKAWVYHGVPGRQLAAIGLLLLVMVGPRPNLPRPFAVITLAIGWLGCVFAVAIGGQYVGFPDLNRPVAGLTTAQQMANDQSQRLKRAAAYGPFVVLSTSLIPPWPTASMVDGVWASRGPCDWIAPAVMQLRRGDEAQRIEAEKLYAIGAGYIADDIKRWQPAVVAVRDSVPRGLISPGNLIEFYDDDPRVADVWTDYRLEARKGDWAYFVRKGSKADFAGSLNY